MTETSFQFPSPAHYENEILEKEILNHLDDLTKPRGSLGRLEECALHYLLCRGSSTASIKNIRLFTCAGDHGVTNRNITPFPREVTIQMVQNMLSGGAAMSVMCKNAGYRYSVVDMGVDGNIPDHPLLLRKKIDRGTADFSTGAAMSAEQCKAALKTGISLATESAADLIGIGEMGIGNSASAAALYALLFNLEGKTTVGSGTGAAGALLAHKKKIVSDAVNMHRIKWDTTPFDALRRVGGFEIAALTGMIIGAASVRIPVVVDGFICGAAALTALSMHKDIKNFLFFSHTSAEKFHKQFLERFAIRPLLDLDMRLGEGTGSVLAMQIIEQALHCYHEMATFSSASVSGKID